MKTLSKKTFLLAMVLLLTSAMSFGQTSTAKLETVQVKLMKMDGKLYLFLTDEQSNPFSNKNIKSSGKAKGENVTKRKLKLASFGENAFVVNSDPGDFDKLKLTFHLKDDQHNEYVYATISNKHNDETSYVCPMHPDEMTKSEGKCPKCDMGLTAKKVSVYEPSKVVRKGFQ